MTTQRTTTRQRLASAPREWAVVPPEVFSAYLRAALNRSDRARRQNSPCNDGRTGFIVNY